jgi:hopanoid-associated phosphorylase
MPVIAVCGLAAEARLARRAGLGAVAAGGDAELTAAQLKPLLAQGAAGLVSFGICGGLDPALAPGTVLLPRAVRTAGGARYPVDPAWHRALLAALRDAAIPTREGESLGTSGISATAAAKAESFRALGVSAVDMESHHAAAIAEAAGMPFLVLRAVADPAARDLPPAALIGLDGEGRPRLAAVLRSLLRSPGQLPALLRLARETRIALAALERAAEAGAAALRTAGRG